MRCTNFTELNKRLVGCAINELREAVYAAGGEVVFNDRYKPVIVCVVGLNGPADYRVESVSMVEHKLQIEGRLADGANETLFSLTPESIYLPHFSQIIAAIPWTLDVHCVQNVIPSSVLESL